MKEVTRRKERLAKKHLRKARRHQRMAEKYSRGGSPNRARLIFIIIILLTAAYIYYKYLRHMI